MKTEFRLFFFVSFFSNHCFSAFRSVFDSMLHVESALFALIVAFAWLDFFTNKRRPSVGLPGERSPCFLLFFRLQQNANHSAVSFVDDFFKCLLNFKLGIFRHVHQLIGQPFSDQVGERFAEKIALP